MTVLSGGSGADRFVFKQNSGSDIVEDFDVTADIIDISHYLVDADDVQFIQRSTGDRAQIRRCLHHTLGGRR